MIVIVWWRIRSLVWGLLFLRWSCIMRSSFLKVSLMSRIRRRSRALLVIFRFFLRFVFCFGVRFSLLLLLWDKEDTIFFNGVGKKKVFKLFLFFFRVLGEFFYFKLLFLVGFYIYLSLGLL